MLFAESSAKENSGVDYAFMETVNKVFLSLCILSDFSTQIFDNPELVQRAAVAPKKEAVDSRQLAQAQTTDANGTGGCGC